MQITTVLFDLDGTLLPMDQEEFTNGYFKMLIRKVAPYGYSPETLVDAIWTGMAAMVRNDGSVSNEDAFWKKFSEIYGEKVWDDKDLFQEFYEKEFEEAKKFCPCNPDAADAVHRLKAMGLRIALATNPIFPEVATRKRICWAGLTPEDFELYTVYENIGCCKPNLAYYREVLKRLQAQPEECLMVGNDVSEDMVAQELGMQVFLLTDCLINKEQKDISLYPHGGFAKLLNYVQENLQRS